MVVDTGVFGARLDSPHRWRLKSSYEPSLADRKAVISFATVAELRFGARRAAWGPRRSIRLETRLAEAETVWVDPKLVQRYVTLRVWCVRNGHGLGQKDHEADRWIAATEMHLGVPLVTHDGIFEGVDGLTVISRV